MAATANLRAYQDQGDEDIAAIAKQISDHAEAIYQTWKAQGLAPSEILNCHNNTQAATQFGSVLTPKKDDRNTSILSETIDDTFAIVNNFVVEDKARMAAAAASQRQKSPQKQMPSSIQFALQKFENPVTPPNPSTTNVFMKKSQQKPQLMPKPVFTNSHISTEKCEKPDVKKPDTPKRPEFLVQNTNNVQTWPLKNKLIESSPEKVHNTLPFDAKSSKPIDQNSIYLDEIAREEERLINALKTGSIIETQKAKPSGTDVGDAKKDDWKILYSKNMTLTADDDKPKNHLTNKAPIYRSKDAVAAEPQKPHTDSQKLDAPTPKTRPISHKIKEKRDEPIDKPLSKDDRDGLSSMSIVDYAKIRYKAAQQQSNTVVDENTNTLVSKVRNKFEPSPTNTSIRWALKPSTRRVEPVERAPHAELSVQRLRSTGNALNENKNGLNPTRPFLTRGSVAERVLIFEKCPSELLIEKRSRGNETTVAGSGAGPRRTSTQDLYQKQVLAQNRRESDAGSGSLHTTLQRHVKAHKNVHIPRFYYPEGKPLATEHLDASIQRITQTFGQYPSSVITKDNYAALTKACNVPLYWKVPLWFAATNSETATSIYVSKCAEFWKCISTTCNDDASRFIYILTRGKRTWLSPEDFITLIQDVVDTHPGLTFLKEATEFHSRYVHTVIARIFYCVNRSWSGRITANELRRANLLHVIKLLEHEEDINQVTQYFSYEHFYVIYCKFWELDRDHDLLIDQQDLKRHNDHALSTRIIERIFSGAVSRGRQRVGNCHDEKMSYTEFVWFLLSEEDKTHPTAIEYWFRCMDLDGDGFLSMYELEYFYEEQRQRIEQIGIETLPFDDCLCQMLDMVNPRQRDKISLSDLKRCKMTSIFFDTFFNLEKYLDHEQRDPFASQHDLDREGHELSDWERYAAEEYEILVAEEGGDGPEQSLYDGPIDDVLSANLDVLFSSSERDGFQRANGCELFRPSEFDDDDDDYAQDSD